MIEGSDIASFVNDLDTMENPAYFYLLDREGVIDNIIPTFSLICFLVILIYC